MLRKLALASGIAASLLYVGIDVLAALRYPGYHSFTDRMISELMAAGAPTERLVDPLFILYGVLMLAFAVGVWRADRRGRVHLTAGLLFVYTAIGFLGPTVAEMDVRGNPTSTADLRHLALTGVVVLLIFAAVAAGSSLFGRGFRRYSIATMVLMLVMGGLNALLMRGAGPTDPTPWAGLVERINIGAFLAWVAVLAVSLLRLPDPSDRPTQDSYRWVLGA